MIKNTLKNALTTALSLTFNFTTFNSKNKLWILMYHRVLPTSDPRFQDEEPGMVVTPTTLDMHLNEIKKLFTPMHLSKWLEHKKNGAPLPPKACIVTFDDGWLDNYEFAWPILQKHNMPATIFLVTDMIGTQREFWPNLLAKLCASLSTQELTEHLSWLEGSKAILAGSANQQEKLAALINQAKIHTDAELYQKLEPLVTALPSIKPALMSWQHVEEMNHSPLIEFGSHTCNHLRLNAQLNQHHAEHEITHSKAVLDGKLNQDTQLFCYPNGDYSAYSAELVKQHYGAAVTTERGINKGPEQLHKLVRIGVHEDISNTRHKFRSRLSGLM